MHPRCEAPLNRRELLGSAAAATFLGLAASGCNHRDRRYAAPYQASATPEPTKPEVLPAEPTEGRLVTGHYAAIGFPGTQPEEPLAPPGRWVSTYGTWQGWVWAPNYLPENTLSQILQEIWDTVPRWDPDGSTLPYPAGPAIGTRVVLIPGPSFAYGSLLVAGLYAPKLWDGSDVIWLGLTDQATRTSVPAGHSYRLYCPAAGHELAHQRTGIRH